MIPKGTIFYLTNSTRTALFKNDSNKELTIKSGMLITTDGQDRNNLLLAKNDDKLKHVIGFLDLDKEITLASKQEVTVKYCESGYVDKRGITIPDGVNLRTIPQGTNKTLEQILLDLRIEVAIPHWEF